MKAIHIAFINKKLKEKFEKLQQGKQDDKELYNDMLNAIKQLKNNREGIKLQKHIWPKEYISLYRITNL